MPPSPVELIPAARVECAIEFEVMVHSVMPRVAAISPTGDAASEAAFDAVLSLTCGWLHSACKLDHPMDFQAAGATCRALFEIAVDAVLLKHDKSTPAASLMAWECSAKLKAAEEMAGCAASSGTVLPAVIANYVATDGPAIRSLRRQHWPARRHPESHPSRWTGRDLRRDAAEASAHRPSAAFAEFYSMRYQQLCWDTHGSGATSSRSLSARMFPGLVAQALHEISTFGRQITDCSMEHLGLLDARAEGERNKISEEQWRKSGITPPCATS